VDIPGIIVDYTISVGKQGIAALAPTRASL
jgi:hypothetical protein